MRREHKAKHLLSQNYLTKEQDKLVLINFDRKINKPDHKIRKLRSALKYLISCPEFRLHNDFTKSLVTRGLSPLPVCVLNN